MSTARPVVLVAPAAAIGSGYYRPLVEELESRGWTAVALARRGFETTGPRASRAVDWSFDDEVQDLADAVAEHRSAHPGRAVVLLGHSLGGQLAAGHQSTRPPADALVTIGTAIPHHRDYPWLGPHLVLFAGVVVPVATTVFGYLPKPAFGGPGARSLMRQWARMMLTGRPAFRPERLIEQPSLVISVEGDHFVPSRGVDAFAARLFDPRAVTRAHCAGGGDRPHVDWVRSPAPVVDRIVAWWEQVEAATV